MANGAPFVMTAGASRKPELSAGSWVALEQYQLNVKHSLEEELVLSGWMKSDAQGQNQPSVNAQQEAGDKMTAIMEKMLVSSVQVGLKTIG